MARRIDPWADDASWPIYFQNWPITLVVILHTGSMASWLATGEIQKKLTCPRDPGTGA